MSKLQDGILKIIQNNGKILTLMDLKKSKMVSMSITKTKIIS